MLKLTNRWANALLSYAQNNNMQKIYRQALMVVVDSNLKIEDAPKELGAFLTLIPGGEEEKISVLHAFLDIAREKMGLLKTEVISAVPLTITQLEDLDKKLSRMFSKQLDITNSVDPSLLGGLRVIVGDTVIDDTIKRKIMDMKDSIYKKVCERQ